MQNAKCKVQNEDLVGRGNPSPDPVSRIPSAKPDIALARSLGEGTEFPGTASGERFPGRTYSLITAILVAMLILVAAMSALAATASVQSDSPLGTSGVGKSEVSLGDLVADAIRAALKTDLAFVSASELKERDAQIAKGKVTTADVTPFIAYPDDPIVEVRLTGRQVKMALERSVLIYPQKNLGFLQVSGLRFSFDPDKTQESRVTSVKVEGGGEAQISDNGTYSVAMTSSMANGALGYWKIWSKNDIKQRPQQITIPQAIESFFAGRNRINYSTLNRITGG